MPCHGPPCPAATPLTWQRDSLLYLPNAGDRIGRYPVRVRPAAAVGRPPSSSSQQPEQAAAGRRAEGPVRLPPIESLCVGSCACRRREPSGDGDDGGGARGPSAHLRLPPRPAAAGSRTWRVFIDPRSQTSLASLASRSRADQGRLPRPVRPAVGGSQGGLARGAFDTATAAMVRRCAGRRRAARRPRPKRGTAASVPVVRPCAARVLVSLSGSGFADMRHITTGAAGSTEIYQITETAVDVYYSWKHAA
ncbi:hypothetical protein BS78_01G430800 [Paspalum vaginatum]|nr:hypothetical protein BS78_01G430800 [Paspalum vaginatum]